MIAKNAHKKLIDELGRHLVSLIAYDKENILVVVDETTLTVLDIIHKHIGSTPLVLRERDITDGLDVFPLEFLHILGTQEVLHGKDVLRGLRLSKTEIREQLEFEIRSKLIRVRTRYLHDPKKAPQEIIAHTPDTLTPLLKGLCALHERRLTDVPTETDALLKHIEDHYKLSIDVLRKIYKNENLKGPQAREATDQLIALLTAMADSVDTMVKA
jgi:hypothetical protein